MSVSIELLDAFKAAQNGCSDYRAAKILGVTQPMVSKYRTGLVPLSPEKVLFIFELCDFDAFDWLLRWHRERARCDKEKAVFDTVLARMAA